MSGFNLFINACYKNYFLISQVFEQKFNNGQKQEHILLYPT